MALNIHRDDILGKPLDPSTGRGQDLPTRMQGLIDTSTIVLFVKGTPVQPMCGFSATVMGIFNRIGVPYATFNILSDPEIRQGAKEFTQWPTFPQIYVGGEFIGGCDIGVQMFQQGELQQVVEEAVASKGLGAIHADTDDTHTEPVATLQVPERARARGEGIAEVRQIRPRKANLMGLDSFLVIDVRNPDELEVAQLEGSHPIPLGEFEQRFNEIPKEANILLMCRVGGRSQRAGEFLIAQGYQHVWNLDGGILAWSDDVDPSITKY